MGDITEETMPSMMTTPFLPWVPPFYRKGRIQSIEPVFEGGESYEREGEADHPVLEEVGQRASGGQA